MSMDVIGQWQEKTLRLSSKLTSATLEDLVLEPMDFPAKNCVVDASDLVKVDSAGVAVLVWLRTMADAVDVALTWQALPQNLIDLLALYELYDEEMIK